MAQACVAWMPRPPPSSRQAPPKPEQAARARRRVRRRHQPYEAAAAATMATMPPPPPQKRAFQHDAGGECGLQMALPVVRYAAAGVLPWRFSSVFPGEALLLLCEEYRASEGQTVLNFFGGKIQEDDNCSAADTAVREMHEECCGLLAGYTLDSMRCRLASTLQTAVPERKAPAFWYRDGRYILFMYYMNHDADIDTRFRALPNGGGPAALLCHTRAVHWVPASAALNCARAMTTGATAHCARLRSNSGAELPQLSRFTANVLAQPLLQGFFMQQQPQ
eukprot:TRINITY_DN17943_c0_g1_i1.p1 TRINITY_DN17943_c0_g1~~TRINITY_DN17943_c0_g1_i1.p1  ORF type:complete len:287 (+),score=68.06 TRINITY_DN17943_c0_g1_i1:29-862(+)